MYIYYIVNTYKFITRKIFPRVVSNMLHSLIVPTCIVFLLEVFRNHKIISSLNDDGDTEYNKATVYEPMLV